MFLISKYKKIVFSLYFQKQVFENRKQKLLPNITLVFLCLCLVGGIERWRHRNIWHLLEYWIETKSCQVPRTTNSVEIDTLWHLLKYWTETKSCQVPRITDLVEINTIWHLLKYWTKTKSCQVPRTTKLVEINTLWYLLTC